jgi:hypothetical protein
MMRRYNIGGKTYIQSCLTLGQLQRLLRLMGLITDSDTPSLGLFASLAMKGELVVFLAIVLHGDGQDIAEAMSNDVLLNRYNHLLQSSIDLTGFQVVEDFMEINSAHSLFGKITETLKIIAAEYQDRGKASFPFFFN